MRRTILTCIFLVLAVLSLKAQDYSTYNGCAEQDSLALVAFYKATDGPNWISNQDGFSINNLSDEVLTYYTTDHPNAGMGKWLVGPVKDWFGVLLEKQPVGTSRDSIWRVVHLRPIISRRSAGNDNLKGYVPKEIGLLTALRWFRVNGNVGFTGTELPKEIWHKSLTDLDIEACYFAGELGKEMRDCPNLTFLNFRYNLLDSVPVFDFMSPDYILNHFSSNGGSTFFYYNNRLRYSNIEASVKYFLTFSNPKQILYEARQQHDVGEEKEIIVQPGQKVVLSCNVGGENGEYTWYKKGFNTYLKGSTYTINSVTAKDTGDYKTLVTNEFVRLNDYNSDYSNVFSSLVHLRFVPSAPFVKTMVTDYGGTEIAVTFTKPMAVPATAQVSDFVVTSNGQPVQVANVTLGGRFSEKLLLKLASPVKNGDVVLVSYNAGSVVCANGGALGSFTNKTVQNIARVRPNPVKAITRDDGSGIFVTFDQYMDPSTMVAADFTVKAGDITYPVNSVILKEGKLDAGISTTVELILADALKASDVISISYKRGALAGLYGSPVESVDQFSVENVILETRTPVLIEVEDGTKTFTSVVVKGTMKNLPFLLVDDGTNGDAIANDHIWSKSLDLNDGQYTWQAYNRTSVTKYDTVRTVDENGTIILKITPTSVSKDDLISSGNSLKFEVTGKTVNGETFYGYKNKTLTFVLNMSTFSIQYPGETVQPYIMGLKDDWSEGTELIRGSEANTWTYSASGFSMGEMVNFNFRNGSIWENASPQSRSHIVAGNDEIYAEFGIFTGLSSQSDKSLSLYPVPAKDRLTIRTPDGFSIHDIKVIDISGREVLVIKGENRSIDVSGLIQGIYSIQVTNVEGLILTSRFIKYN
ncbi:MAG: SwmB domain-containing protein [Bacteroidota bacterium]|nr:SwmB domain-containing protein [Bacteroidota bacterium]